MTLLTAYSAFTRVADLCVFANDGNVFVVNFLLRLRAVFSYKTNGFAMQRNKSVRDFLLLVSSCFTRTEISVLTACKINFANKTDSCK